MPLQGSYQGAKSLAAVCAGAAELRLCYPGAKPQYMHALLFTVGHEPSSKQQDLWNLGLSKKKDVPIVMINLIKQ